MHIYNATISNNVATDLGGAIYMPNSTGAFTYIGEENELVEGRVTFSKNSAADIGGAIYARNYLSIENTTFSENTSKNSGGAIAAGALRMYISNTEFTGNTSTAKHGGAIYLYDENERDEREAELLNCTFTANSAATYAGAIYIYNGAVAYMRNANFTSNTSKYGGAIFASGGHFEINNAEFKANSATTNGGAIALYSTSTATMNKINAEENTANAGGFMYATESSFNLYNSTLEKNSAVGASGAVSIYTGASANIYATSFIENTAGANAGAVTVYNGGLDVMLHSCFFQNNVSGNFGGALFISNKSQVKLYQTTAIGNDALYGGFMYETTSGTVVTIGGLTVKGNTADNGPMIWGNTNNAKLYLDKAEFADLDSTGNYDSAYWKTAIANKLTVYDATVEVPKYLDYGNEPYDHMKDAVDVKNADELEAAILSGAKYIRVVADFELDRTFYITNETVIFSTIARTLTRAKSFGGDILVVGESKEGVSALLLGGNAKLTLGNPLSVQENLLVIDGNRDNMEVDVYGSVIFISYSSIVDLHVNVTVQNCMKVGNERANDEKHRLPSTGRIGGAMAIVASGSLNIYGGHYLNNSVRDDVYSDELGEAGRASTNGGLIFNRGNVFIYDGVFYGNHAARGGMMYNYRVAVIYGGTFEANSASASGGAIYTPSSATARMTIGTSVSGAAKVIFKENTSVSHGGAIYSSPLNTFVIYGNTEFIGNTAGGSGGAITAYGQMTVRNTLFLENTANNRGGAIYTSYSAGDYVTRFAYIGGCEFEGNKALLGGAIQAYAGSSDFANGALVTVEDTIFTANEALDLTGDDVGAGGAIHADRKSEITVKNSTFDGNTSTGEAGAIYAIGACKVDLIDSVIKNSTAIKAGGAISARSVTFNIINSDIINNVSGTNGGAIYVSYSSNYDVNTKLTVKDSKISGNTAEGIGGAIYATRHAITTEHRVLDIRDTVISSNTAGDAAGAIYTSPSLQAYLKDVTVSENTAKAEGGAFYVNGSVLEIDGATMHKNTTTGQGGTFFIENSATVTLNRINATESSSSASGGFLYLAEATLKMYNSTVKDSYTPATGGAMALYGSAVAEIYNTVFDGNRSDSNGGALTVYTGGTTVRLQDCTFQNNVGVYGGGAYVSGESILNIYNATATANSATKGGFLYITTTGTEVTLNGATVGENTATDGGSIIWGNSTGAKLHINKTNYTDTSTESLDDAYWSAAIYNKLKVDTITTAVPTYKDYAEKADPEVVEPEAKDPVPVDPIFELAQKSSDEAINSTYDKFPKLDNSSNFMSKNETKFENINGETVTVDSFVYPTYGIADNINVGQGLMIYQAMCYKKAYPDEEVYIDIASYRFSVQAAVNINRNSRYFGYMRQLSGVDYDEYGFVRIAYLLICAAKMGIHVNVVPHTDAYPLTAGDRNLEKYFTTQLGDPCDPAYVENGIVSDYLDFNHVKWSLTEKGGTDMMHTKLCAVSHYLDMNGEVHRNAVWTSSSNLDGVKSSGENANWKLQTATIVSDHEAIYRTSVNYLRLIAKYREQEQVSEFQHYVNRLNVEQAALILEGRESEIPADEQIIYLGRETDDVFELYFTPLGGDILEWDEIQNPYAKYLRKLYNSEDYITFAWNAAEYSNSYNLGQYIEEMLIAAFHNNRNPKNMIYGMMENLDATTFDDLVVGVDIGYKSFNEYRFGSVHNKDVHMSYVENGQRYYVSILNSMNPHSGSMYFQSNFALVVKEKDCSDDSVFSTITKYSVSCDLAPHTFDEEIYIQEATSTEHGCRYRICEDCGDHDIVEVLHYEGEWVTLLEAVPGRNGMRYKKCLVCGVTTRTEELISEETNRTDLTVITGTDFVADMIHRLDGALAATPHTFEAIVQLAPSVSGRGGIIFSNNGSGGEIVSFEIYTNGRVRLYYTNNGTTIDCIFNYDIRSNDQRHIAVTMDENNVASLYVDGQFIQSKTLALPLPVSTDGYMIGADLRKGNTQYFKGMLYSLNLFGDARTAEEIEGDTQYVATNADQLIFTKNFDGEEKNTDEIVHGSLFKSKTLNTIGKIDSMPHTIEALVQVKGDVGERQGSIFSNYGLDPLNAVALEIYTGGRVRLFVANGGVKSDCLFDANILSGKPVHIALTVDGKDVSLYINGAYSQTLTMKTELPELNVDFAVGGDYRRGNSVYFKGTIYSVNVFEDVRSAIEIAEDAQNIVPTNLDQLLFTKVYSRTVEKEIIVTGDSLVGETFTADQINSINGVEITPYTFEALLQVNGSTTARYGAVISNYSANATNAISIEIYTGGRVRLFTINGGVRSDCIFDANILSDKPVHIAIAVDGMEASLYINGEFSQTLTMSVALPEITEALAIGGDYRSGNSQYFRGKIYSVNLFGDTRSAEEIEADMLAVAQNAENLLYSAYSYGANEMTPMYGQKFKKNIMGKTFCTLTGTPHTFEAVIQLPKSYNGRGGIIIGNNGGAKNQINFEVYTEGRVRFYFVNNGTTIDCVFNTDVRSDTPVHVAVTMDGNVATLYVNGEVVEQRTLALALAESRSNFMVGGDGRVGNTQYFKGTLYSVNLFEEVRTAEAIRTDMLGLSAKNALYSMSYFSSGDKILGENDLHGDVKTTVIRVPSEDGAGVLEYSCVHCGKTLRYAEFMAGEETNEIYNVTVGAMEKNVIQKIDKTFTTTAKTFEFLMRLPTTVMDSERAGVLLGNYDGTNKDQINIEAYYNGNLRLYYKVGGTTYTIVFDTDVRSENLTHIALVVDELEAKLYVNGVLAETKTLSTELPEVVNNLCIGGDNRTSNPQYFAGELYSVHLFDDVRTESEIAQDMIGVTETEDGLLFAKNRVPSER